MENELKVFRAREDITQKELATEMDVSRQAINAIETGKYDPSLGLALKLSDFFDCSVEDLFKLDDDYYGELCSFEGFLKYLGMRIGAAAVFISVYFGLGYVKRTDSIGLGGLLGSGIAFFYRSFRNCRIFMDIIASLPVLCRISTCWKH